MHPTGAMPPTREATVLQGKMMNLLPLGKLGAREVSPGRVEMGLFLPGISAQSGYRLRARIIHERDQFIQGVQPVSIDLDHAVDGTYGDYWSADVDIAGHDPGVAGSAWGRPGRYVYRYCLEKPHGEGTIDWIVDPFAREFGVGTLSAFQVGYAKYAWSSEEATWQTPRLHDLVIYELMISEFGGSVAGALDRLDYLADLGINCIEVMPLSNVALTVDWGFLPIGHFGVDERFGKRDDMQRFIDAAHARGIAVIVDAVYGHTGDDFPYEYLYSRINVENPMMGAFGDADMFGKSTDFGKSFTRDFFYTVNHYWLDRYHIDGFRYDCVPNYYDGPAGQGYAELVYRTYEKVRDELARPDPGHWRRFGPDGASSRLIQCAEHLDKPLDVVERTYTNCSWQNGTLAAAEKVARGGGVDLPGLGMRLGLTGWPDHVAHDGDTLATSALQYLENHDHSRFVCNFATIAGDNELFRQGDRAKWYKLQPHLIGLFTARGLPLLWQGQEFGENYWLPTFGMGRVVLLRPVRWDYFYDETGKATVGLVRKLVALRRGEAQFRQGEHYFYNHDERYHRKDVLMFSRYDDRRFSLVALNFGDEDQWVPFWFPIAGEYREALHDANALLVESTSDPYWLRIPSNYGRIWTHRT